MGRVNCSSCGKNTKRKQGSVYYIPFSAEHNSLFKSGRLGNMEHQHVSRWAIIPVVVVIIVVDDDDIRRLI